MFGHPTWPPRELPVLASSRPCRSCSASNGCWPQNIGGGDRGTMDARLNANVRAFIEPMLPNCLTQVVEWWNSRMIDAILQVVEERTRRRDISQIVHGDQTIQNLQGHLRVLGVKFRQTGSANRVPQRSEWQPLAFAGSRQYLVFRNISGGHICGQSYPLYNSRYHRSTQTDTCN